MTIQDTTANNNQCPKCGSTMHYRKMWVKMKHLDILQCNVCRFYEEIPKAPKVPIKKRKVKSTN